MEFVEMMNQYSFIKFQTWKLTQFPLTAFRPTPKRGKFSREEIRFYLIKMKNWRRWRKWKVFQSTTNDYRDDEMMMIFVKKIQQEKSFFQLLSTNEENGKFSFHRLWNVKTMMTRIIRKFKSFLLIILNFSRFHCWINFQLE